ncbi:MAG: RagB/SusD family nutrient uptake outer membrane protein [Bacteroidia bacterium]
MKLKYFLILLISSLLFGISCSDEFLDQPPLGAYSAPSLANLKGVEGMLIGAYSVLDGLWFESWDNNHFNQAGGASNWIWGSIRAEDAYKGTEPSDFVDINPIERFEVQPSSPPLSNKWNASYDGIGRVNETLRTLAIAEGISESDTKRIAGEARFLRGHFHFEAMQTFGNPAYVDETVTDYPSVKNDHKIWPEIEADFKFAFDNLPEIQTAAGRANKWAAACYLAKTYMFQGKWSEAKALFDQITVSGVTSTGVKYALTDLYADNFHVAAENGNPESIFAFEASSGDGSISNGNYENTLNMPHGSSSRAACCGFFQPTQTLVNSFKVDANGLPLLDTFNDVDVKNDEGLASTDPFTPDAGTLDPRLDWTVGRRGIPYMDWGLHPGNNWIRAVVNGGPYSPKKNVPRFEDFDGGTAGVYDWGFTLSSLNVHILRYADILLLAAEAEAELNNLDDALAYVNMVRQRAANPAGFVKLDDGSNAANYLIGTYSGFGSQAEALKAIRFERKIELGMEGRRFFDLVRWHLISKEGKSALPFDIVSHMNAYLAKESIKRNHLANATFTEKYIYAPIPEYVITQSTVNGVRNIVQNEGF